MVNMVNVADIVEANGKTIRQNNMEKKHKFKVGDLVEIVCNCSDNYYAPGKHYKNCGLRLFVAVQSRDCDGSLGYYLSPQATDKTFDMKEFSVVMKAFLDKRDNRLSSNEEIQNAYVEVLSYVLKNPKGHGLHGEDGLILVRGAETSEE